MKLWKRSPTYKIDGWDGSGGDWRTDGQKVDILYTRNGS